MLSEILLIYIISILTLLLHLDFYCIRLLYHKIGLAKAQLIASLNIKDLMFAIAINMRLQKSPQLEWRL